MRLLQYPRRLDGTELLESLGRVRLGLPALPSSWRPVGTLSLPPGPQGVDGESARIAAPRVDLWWSSLGAGGKRTN